MNPLNLADQAAHLYLCVSFLVGSLGQNRVGLNAEETAGLAFILGDAQTLVAEIRTGLEAPQ